MESARAYHKYSYPKVNNDLGVIKLDRDIQFKDDKVQPICLPLQDDGKSDVVKGHGKVRFYADQY